MDRLAAAVDAAIGAWLAARHAATAALPLNERALEHDGDDVATVDLVVVMVDGKPVRGASTVRGHQVHLLAAATQEHSLVLAQTEVGVKRTRSRCSHRCWTRSTSTGP